MDLDALARRLDALEAGRLSDRLMLDRLLNDAVRRRRSRTEPEEDLVGRLSPGTLTGGHGVRRGRPDTLPDLGSPLLSRLRDDPSLQGMSDGRLDPGRPNLLFDPLLDRFVGAGALTTAYVAHGEGWEAKYTLNSGTVATTRTADHQGGRGAKWPTPIDDYVYGFESSSNVVLTLVFGTAACDMTVFIRPSTAWTPVPEYLPSWITAAVKMLTPLSDTMTSATATLQITDAADVVLAESDPLDLLAIETLVEVSGLQTGYQTPVTTASYRWRLRIDAVKAAGAVAELQALFCDPQLSYSDDGTPPPFTPNLGFYWMSGSPGYQLVGIPFALLNIPAGATTELQVADNALGIGSPRIRAPWAGSIVGLSYRMSAAVGAGTLALEATRNGTSVWTAFAAGLLAIEDGATQRPGTDIFGATGVLGVQAVASAGITAGLDIAAMLWVLVNYTGT